MFWILRGSESKFLFIDDGDIEMGERTPVPDQERVSKIRTCINSVNAGDTLRITFADIPFDSTLTLKLSGLIAIHGDGFEFEDAHLPRLKAVLKDGNWSGLYTYRLKIGEEFCRQLFVAMIVRRGYLESAEVIKAA